MCKYYTRRDSCSYESLFYLKEENLMPSLKGRAKAKTESQETKGTKTVEVRMRKVEFEKNPSLKAFFTATVTGYPVATRVTFTEKEKEESDDTEEINPDDFNILFQSKVGKDGKRYPLLHPIDAETRNDIKLNILSAFKRFFEDEKDVFVDENDIAVSQVAEKNYFKGQVGDALVQTTRTMALKDMELHVNKDGNYYITYPSYPSKQKNAEGKYDRFPYYWPQKDSDTTQAILEAAVKEYEKA